MGLVANPVKAFNYRVEVDGLAAGLCQDVQLPEIEIETVEHGEENEYVETPGKVRVGEAVLQNLVPIEGDENWAYEWLTTAQDAENGGGGLREDYTRTVTVLQLAPDKTTTVRRHILTESWCKKLAHNNLAVGSSDNTMQTVTLSVRRHILS